MAETWRTQRDVSVGRRQECVNGKFPKPCTDNSSFQKKVKYGENAHTFAGLKLYLIIDLGFLYQ